MHMHVCASLCLSLYLSPFLSLDRMRAEPEPTPAGTYCTPSLVTAVSYGRPQVLFNDGVFHRCILELEVDWNKVLKHRTPQNRSNVQWVFNNTDVKLCGFWSTSTVPHTRGNKGSTTGSRRTSACLWARRRREPS